MPEIWEDHEDDSELVRQLRKQIKDTSKSKTEAEARAAAAEGKLTERNLTEILSAKGVNPKAAKFLVKDGVDASDENAVTSWLEENSDLFPSSITPAESPADEGPTVDDETVQGYQQVAGTNLLQRPADMNKFAEVDRSLPADATPEMVFDAMRKAGI